MGVPKFFRYISERYPCLSELVKEYQIPEFDNLYLDMNGIIHMCSHPDDGNPHFRITEEKIFKDVFHYIEVLFRMIRPQKLFFMAVDGVAPRAKMNQQRGRRFRSAKDADKQEAEALKKGEKLPDEARFDSNCITPGTVFMARLHEQLKYFVVDKISNDPTWQKCKVILSGHETPGEGEHKIMDYIRYLRAQPNYDPNTRHCLYGLDADLIMLGLCTHEPHFSLLREEVKFGKKSTKRQSVPEEITFFLLHLSLMREYLELEFASLQSQLKGFDYDFEKIIDDWVLMGFLVGNDFIPHLPNLHITNGALPILYKAYMNILPTLDGYINESGTLNLARFEKFMENLSCIDLENFEEIREDLLYMEAKTGRKYNAHVKVSTKPLEEWTSEENDGCVPLEAHEPGRDTRDEGLAALIKATDDLCMESDDETDMSDEDDAFRSYKKDYYKNKLEYTEVTPEVMRAQAEGYVRAIQWNLYYYYNGCCSWSWFYPHHYAPYISDIKGFADLKIDFEYGKPFLPYEQLLAVLPSASMNLLPSCYHHLMKDENSIIKQYYPQDFQTDLNGKKQEWEAVVLVPFIDENLLLEAMSYCNDKLTEEEKERNSHGPMLIYTYTPRDQGPYNSPEYFPTITSNHTELSTMMYNDILLPREMLVKGAYPGVKMDVYYPGFPTMKHLKYKAELKKAKIKVFEQASRNENMIITIIPPEKFLGEMIPVDLLGTTVFVRWPHLIEAKVVAISNGKRKYVSMGEKGQYNVEELGDDKVKQFKQEIAGTVEYFQRRMGIEVGDTKVLVHVQVMIGRCYAFTPNGRVTLDKQFSQNVSNYPLQTVVFNISTYDSHQSVFRDIGNVFPKDSACFTLTNPYYGSQGLIQDSRQYIKIGRIKICISVLEEPNFATVTDLHSKTISSYRNLYSVASQLSISNMLFSRITGSIYVSARNNEGGLKNINIGLDLKLNKKNKETPGYTKKIENTWCYSDKAVDLVRIYCDKFPEVIEYLCKDNSFEDIVAEKIFGNDWDDKIKELQNWLRSLPIYSLEKQTCGSAVLEEEVVKEIERVVDSCKNTTAKKVTMQIKPNFLYRPEIQNGTLIPDPKTETRILDRIVNVREGFSVPFGLKGTVIAVKQSSTGNDRDQMYDVVFDKAFKDGMTLSCSEGRGYRLPPTAFINISHGQRLLAAKTGKADEIITKAEASHHSSYQNRPQERFENFAQESFSLQKFPQQKFNEQSNSAFAQFYDIAKRPQREEENPKQVYPSSSKLTNTNQQYAYQKTEKHNFEQWRVPQSYTNNIRNGGYTDKKLQRGMESQKINCFMPDFKESSQGKKINNSSQRQPTKVERNPEFSKSSYNVGQNMQQPIKVDKIREIANAPNDAVQNTRCKVDTDFLKSILKIGEPPQSTGHRKVEVVPSTSQNNVLDDLRSTSLDFNKLSQVANAPASIRLLTYYQSNGLGLPRYQYFSCGNMIQAQININKKIIVGQPAKTREEASENVAKDVLEVLMNKVNYSENVVHVNKNFPVPPKTWVQPENMSEFDQKDKRVIDNEEDQKAGNRKTEATAVLSNSFVPLQAIKNHIKPSNANKKMEESIKENIKQPSNAPINTNEYISKDQRTSVNQHKPKKERKTRIAANFQK